MIEHDIGVRSELFSGIPRSEATGLLTLAVLGSPFQLGVYSKPFDPYGRFLNMRDLPWDLLYVYIYMLYHIYIDDIMILL